MNVIVEDKGCVKGCGYLSRIKDTPFSLWDHANERAVSVSKPGQDVRFTCRKGGEHHPEIKRMP